MPSTSVIIPAYNAAAYLGAAVASALDQTCRRQLEIIVVDDGSTDSTPEVARAYGREITYLRQERNRGPAAARNLGIRHSRAKEFVAFLDADDTWLPQKIERQMEVMSSRPEVGLVCCDFSRIDESGVIAASNKALRRPASGWVFAELWQRNFISTPTVLARRDCLEAVGLFDEALRYGEDWHLWLRIAHRFPVQYLDAALACVRVREESLSRGDPDDRLQAHLETIESLARLFPELAGKPARVRRALAYFRNGWTHFSGGDHRAARKRFRSAAAETVGQVCNLPMTARAHIYLAATYLPPQCFSVYRAAKRRLRRLARAAWARGAIRRADGAPRLL